MTRAYFGHHKCASTWVRRIVDQVLNEVGISYGLVLDPMTPTAHGKLHDYRTEFDRSEIGDWIRRTGHDYVSFITADQEQADAVPDLRGFHVIRDPRDILVSAYFSHRNSHPTDNLDHMAAHRERLLGVPKDAGLLLEFEYSASELEDLGQWNYHNPNVLELKMEDLTTNAYHRFIEIFRFLDLLDEESTYLASRRIGAFANAMRNRISARFPRVPGLNKKVLATPEMLLGRVFDNRFEKSSGGRKRGVEDENSHYRKGVAGDWQNHFSAEHCAVFAERFPTLLQVTGYEANQEWISSHLANALESGFS